jgi:hypothetical protein
MECADAGRGALQRSSHAPECTCAPYLHLLCLARYTLFFAVLYMCILRLHLYHLDLYGIHYTLMHSFHNHEV